MRIRITKRSTIPLVDCGKIFTVDSVSQEDDGERVFWIHHIGNYFAIPGDMCEVLPERSVCEAVREVEL